MKYVTMAVLALISTLTQAATIPTPPNTVPEPETLALIGIAGIAVAVTKYFGKK